MDRLLLTRAVSQGRMVSDPADYGKFAIKTQGGRRSFTTDDAATASMMAMAEDVLLERGAATLLRSRARWVVARV